MLNYRMLFFFAGDLRGEISKGPISIPRGILSNVYVFNESLGLSWDFSEFRFLLGALKAGLWSSVLTSIVLFLLFFFFLTVTFFFYNSG